MKIERGNLMATKAQSEVKEVKTETKAKPKKAVIKADTIVRVYNNTTGGVSSCLQ